MFDAARFANDWIDNWNCRDVDAVLSHLADDVVFESPLAEKICSKSVISGKGELERYWRAALSHARSLRFVLEDFSWDEAKRTLLVRYVSYVNDRIVHACEVMVFDAAGRQRSGHAYYGYAGK